MLRLSMRLGHLAEGVAGAVVQAGARVDVRAVVHDSREAGPGDLFVAVRGLRSDGHDFAASAAGRGAAVAVERPVPLPPGTPWLLLADSRLGLAELSAALHGRPSRRLRVVGVTGTAGKTTTTHLTASALEAAGMPAGYLSSIALRSTGQPSENESGQTTLEPPQVQAWLARMAAEGAEAAVLEVSSHALDQGRVAACDFDVAAVTNVGHDHVGYHRTRAAYLRAKARLVQLCASASPKGLPKTAVLNRDDSSFDALAAYPIPRRITYGVGASRQVWAAAVRPVAGGTAFQIRACEASAEVRLRLTGRFNVANALCAAACGLALDLPLDGLAEGLSAFPGLRGRLERVDVGQPFTVYVDFAHSADGLASVLRELRRTAGGRLLVVFGASSRSGGHHPAGMGRAAAAMADYFVITSDDPVDVDPAELARQVEAGVAGREPGRDYEVELDRRAAIRRALALARSGDVVLLAGKGHERTLELAGGPVPWDERAEAEAGLRALGLATT
jgi:UDP-N-acetylmuramoyl-L-alanyl-D-glutamate--2,6-diaminopimelate ligase